jgi:hypothetical protein
MSCTAPHGLAGQTLRGLSRGSLIVLALLLLGGSPATSPSAAGDADPKAETKQALAQLREYLPTLLQKGLLENERANLRRLEMYFRLNEGLKEGGDSSQDQLDLIEQDLLESRIAVLRRETSYEEDRDRFQLRFNAPARRLPEMEAQTLPLEQQLGRYEDVRNNWDKANEQLARSYNQEDVRKTLSQVRMVLSTADLVKDTPFHKEFPGRLAAWENLSEEQRSKLQRHYSRERRTLLEQMENDKQGGKQPGEKERLCLREIEMQGDLGDFLQALREYESQPWKKTQKPDTRLRQQIAMFSVLRASAAGLLMEARNERLEDLRAKWPALPAVRLQGVDVLASDWNRAEQVAAALFKKPEGLVSGKSKIRRLRTLAATYLMERRLLELAYLRVQMVEDEQLVPPAPAASAPDDPAGMSKPFEPVQRWLAAQRSWSRTKTKIWTTWIDYHMARLDLYRELDLTPPRCTSNLPTWHRAPRYRDRRTVKPLKSIGSGPTERLQKTHVA